MIKSKNSNQYGKIPDIPEGFTMPFYYSSLLSVDVFYLIPIEKAKSYLRNASLKVADFAGNAVIGCNFQLFSGQFSSGIDNSVKNWIDYGVGITQGVELYVVVHTKNSSDSTPVFLSFEQFILGEEQSKILGNYMIFMPCDGKIAIKAGEVLFGEPKVKTTFKTNFSGENFIHNNIFYQPCSNKRWGFQVNDPVDKDEFIFRYQVDLSNFDHLLSNQSPTTEYGIFNDKLIACRCNMLQPMKVYFLDKYEADRVKLIFGNSLHEMKLAMADLIGSLPSVAVRTFFKPSVAVKSEYFFVDQLIN
jgi:hypothetical protein